MSAHQTIHLERYDADAKAAVAGAQILADARKHAQIEPIHLLARMLAYDRAVAAVFKNAGIDTTALAAAAEEALAKLAPAAAEPGYLSAAMLALLVRAEKEATRLAQSTVTLEHLLNALAQEIRGDAGALFASFGMKPGALRPHMEPVKNRPAVVPVPALLEDAKHYTRGAHQVLGLAQKDADRRRHVRTTAVHLLARLVGLKPIQERLREAKAEPEVALAAAEEWLASLPTGLEPSYLSSDALAALELAKTRTAPDEVTIAQLLEALVLFASTPVRETLEDLDRRGIDLDGEREALARIIALGKLAAFANAPS